MKKSARNIRIILVFALFLAGCSNDDQHTAKKEPVLDAIHQWQQGKSRLALQGEELYKQYCAICHGENIDGQGFNSYLLNPKPADLRPFAKEQSREHVLIVIDKGTSSVGKSPLCPPWGGIISLSKRESIFEYLIWAKANSSE